MEHKIRRANGPKACQISDHLCPMSLALPDSSFGSYNGPKCLISMILGARGKLAEGTGLLEIGVSRVLGSPGNSGLNYHANFKRKWLPNASPKLTKISQIEVQIHPRESLRKSVAFGTGLEPQN